MLKDKINQRLLGVLTLLIMLYVVSGWIQGRKGASRVLSASLIYLDTTVINRIEIEKSGQTLFLFRNGKDWMIRTDDEKEVPAVNERINSMMASLMHLQPIRIAANDPAKWRDYQVDSSGTRIRLLEGSVEKADLVIGRGGMEGQMAFYTYVRPYDQNNVYVVENFSGSSVSVDPARYRDRNILSLTPDSVHQLTFDYRDTEGFTLFRSDSVWNIDGEEADSAAVADYLKELRRITGSEFVDADHPSSGTPPDASLQIKGSDEIWIRLYGTGSETYLLHSSQNPVNYFSDTSVIHSLFLRKEDFIGAVEE